MHGIKWGKVDINLRPEKIVIVGSGTSLTGFNFDQLRNKNYYIICVNDAINHVSFADAWFTLDPWGLDGRQLPDKDFKGQLFAAVPEDFGMPQARIREHSITAPNNITYLHRIVFHSSSDILPSDYETWGLNEDTGSINTLNSGYGAFNLAYHYRPKKILLLGLDAGSGYFYDNNKSTRPLSHLPAIFASTLPQINKANISVINGSAISKINCFEKFSPNAALANFI